MGRLAGMRQLPSSNHKDIKKRPKPIFLFCFCFFNSEVHRGKTTGSFILVNNGILRGFSEGLLKFFDRFFCFRQFAFLQKRLPVAIKGLQMSLHTRVAGSACLVFAQIFNGGVFIWHKRMSVEYANQGETSIAVSERL